MARKKKSKLTDWQNLAKKGGTCTGCKVYYSSLTVDHIIPKQILELLSPDAVFEDEENFELVCHLCNKYKAHRIDIRNPKTRNLLLKYVQKLPIMD